MKSYTDLEQSRKLAEILPTESADMRYSPLGDKMHPWVWTDTFIEKDAVPCWSLTALFSMLPKSAYLEKGSSTELYRLILPVELISSDWNHEQIDACVEMILKLHELKIL